MSMPTVRNLTYYRRVKNSVQRVLGSSGYSPEVIQQCVIHAFKKLNSGYTSGLAIMEAQLHAARIDNGNRGAIRLPTRADWIAAVVLGITRDLFPNRASFTRARPPTHPEPNGPDNAA